MQVRKQQLELDLDQQTGKVFQCEITGGGTVGQRIVHHDAQRDQGEQQHKHDVGRAEQ